MCDLILTFRLNWAVSIWVNLAAYVCVCVIASVVDVSDRPIIASSLRSQNQNEAKEAKRGQKGAKRCH